MSDREIAIAAATLALFPMSIRKELIAERNFIRELGLPVSTMVKFHSAGKNFKIEDLYDCAQSVFAGADNIEIKESETDAVWIASGFDPECATFKLSFGKSEITIDGYWPLQPDADERLKSFEITASKVLLPRNCVESWSAKIEAGKLSCPELVALEQDIERSFAVVSSKIRREIDSGSGDLQTLVPSDPMFWRTAYPVTTEAPVFPEFVNREIKTWISAGTRAYGVNFYPEALRLCIHSSVADAIANESLSNDEWVQLADYVERSGSMYSKLGFVETVLAQDDIDVTLQERVAGIIDFLLEETKKGRFGLLSYLFFFVSGRLSLSAVFDDLPVYVRRLVEFSYASFLEEILISKSVDANTVAFELAQRVARRAFVVGHLDAFSEVRWKPEFAAPSQLKAEFVRRLSIAFANKEAALDGTPLEKFIQEGSDKRISDRLKFPYSFLPGPLEGGTEPPADLPENWKSGIESELKKDPPSLAGFNGLVDAGAVFKLPAEIVSQSVAALRRIDLTTDADGSFSVGAFVEGLTRVAAICRNEQLAEETWQLIRRVLRQKPDALEWQVLFSLPITLSAVYAVERRENKLVEMIEFFSHCRLTLEQSFHLGACVEDFLDIRPDLWSRLGKATALLKAQQIKP